ncbi:gp53-like domain-containing protein [Morganella morganii]|uniref:gp53-like domain-containing protein n=1 Tax=Morganella morganii TaxID=582 RepID=UPI00301C706E
MKKIGDVTSTADKNGEWTNGNVAAGIAPTILEAGWLNSVQREILGVLTKAGIPQDKNNDTQLAEAISAIISGGDYATKTEVNSKLAKDKNGADIPDKPKFIENLGLPELLANKVNFDDIVRELSDDWYKVPSVSLLDQELGKKVSSTTFNQEMNKKADKNSLGTASSKNTGNGAGQIPDMSHFPFSGKGTDSIVVTLPNGLIIQSFKRILLHSDNVGEAWNNTVNFPVAFPEKVVAVLCTKNGYPQVTVSCEGVNLIGFNALTIKLLNLSTGVKDTLANFLVLGY